MIRILVNGAQGKMGQETIKAVSQAEGLLLVAECGHQDNLAEIIRSAQADVVIDFTRPDSVYENTVIILESGARPIIGTTGLLLDQINDLQQLAKLRKTGGIIAPNFSIGALLMMYFAQQAAKYLPTAEIIELHHDKKQDAPSGTAIKTANMIAQARTRVSPLPACTELIPGARGANQENIPIHAVRLPGFLAHQMVIFGGEGETLTLKHDSINRSCFMPGVIMACHKVMELNELIYGLEQLLFNKNI